MAHLAKIPAKAGLRLWLAGFGLLAAAWTIDASEAPKTAPQALLTTYDRLLPLEGGSNFRDAGGYFTDGGLEVRRGAVYRSGAMTSISDADREYLERFGFQRIVDLRSTEERELYPTRWATETGGVSIAAHDYSIRELMAKMAAAEEDGEITASMPALYRGLPYLLEPQLRLFFNELLAGHTPLVVNCSAGQDRTGVSVALLLLALGVPEDVVTQDYLQSTRYRNPVAERGDIDLAAAAEQNFFARLMLRYGANDEGAAQDGFRAEPLLTDEGVPFLRFALDTIEQDFGSVKAFLEERVGIDDAALARLRAQYLVSPAS